MAEERDKGKALKARLLIVGALVIIIKKKVSRDKEGSKK